MDLSFTFLNAVATSSYSFKLDTQVITSLYNLWLLSFYKFAILLMAFTYINNITLYICMIY